MKNFRARRGPFTERPYYTNEEIERTCSDELRAVGLFPAAPEPIRIDRFVEKRFGVSHDYEDLPQGVLGYTRFGKQGVQGIMVARSLDDNSEVSERRIRSTLAHEVGHGLLHAHLFVLNGQSALFPEGKAAKPRVLCRDERDASNPTGYRGEWWEYQANRAIGALLLPRPLVMKAVGEFLVPRGGLGLKSLPGDHRMIAAKHLAGIFEVNPAVASIRLGELFPVQSEAQQAL
jgi:hypothetical protein